jgi:hypothetical protein
MTDSFQDGRRRHVGNSSACDKMDICRSNSMKFVSETETDMLSLKIAKAGVYGHFQDGRSSFLGNSSVCYKRGNYRPISMNFFTQTKTGVLSSKITKRKCAAKKTAKVKCKNRYRFEKATLCKREVSKKQKCFILWHKLPYSYKRLLGNCSLNFRMKCKLWCMRVFQASSVIEILIHV